MLQLLAVVDILNGKYHAFLDTWAGPCMPIHVELYQWFRAFSNGSTSDSRLDGDQTFVQFFSRASQEGASLLHRNAGVG